MDAFVGQIMSFGFNYAPQGWLPCDGRLLPISSYETLYTLVGTTYGGDGQSTFALPDLRGRVPIHMGQGPGLSTYVMGQKAGVEQVTLLPANMPPHTHTPTVTAGANNGGVITAVTATLNATTTAATVTSAPTNILGGGHGAVTPYAPATTTPVAAMANALTVTGSLPLPTVTVNPAGSSIPVSVLQSYQVVSYCICWAGIYPQQN